MHMWLNGQKDVDMHVVKSCDFS